MSAIHEGQLIAFRVMKMLYYSRAHILLFYIYIIYILYIYMQQLPQVDYQHIQSTEVHSLVQRVCIVLYLYMSRVQETEDTSLYEGTPSTRYIWYRIYQRIRCRIQIIIQSSTRQQQPYKRKHSSSVINEISR